MKDTFIISDKEGLEDYTNEIIALLVESSEGRSLMDIQSISTTNYQDTVSVTITFKKKANYASIM